MKISLSFLITGILFFVGIEAFGQCPNADMNVSGINSGCEGQPITVDNNTTNPTQVDSFVWRWNNDVDHGYPDTSITVLTTSSQTHTYIIPNTAISNNCNQTSLEFEIELEIFDECNINPSKNSSPIFIYIKPRTLFNTSTSVICAGEEVFFNNSTCPSISPGISYLWDFGDLTTGDDISTDANPSYIYSEVGTYTVTLTATNDDAAPICGTLSDSYSMQITVLPAPEPQYTLSAISLNATQDTMCAGDVLTIASSHSSDSINIDVVPMSGVTILPNDYTLPANINFSNSGDYLITITYYQCNGANPCDPQNIICSKDTTFTIHVLPSSGATLNVDPCINTFIVDFNNYFGTTGSGAPPSGVVWNFLDINENTIDPSQSGINPTPIDYTSEGFGTYIVEVIYPDPCNNQTLRDTFTIGEVATFNSIADYCVGTNVQINLDSLIITPANGDFTWSGNGVYVGNNGDDSLDVSMLSVGNNQTVTYIDPSGCNPTDDLTFNILDGATIGLNPFPSCFTDTIFNVNSYVIPPNGTYDTVYWEVYYLPNITTPVATYDTLYPGDISVQLDSTLIKVTLVSQCGTSTDSGYIYVPDILVLDTLTSQCSNVDTCINLNDLILSPTDLCLTWSGNGVNGNCFNPSNANIGFNTISYVGCTDACYSGSFVVEVTDGSSSLQDDQICINSPFIALDKVLQDGIWSSNGSGVVNDTLFPNLMSAGIFEVYYQSDSGSLCFVRDTFIITIDDAVTALVHVNSPNCVDSIFTFTNTSIHNVVRWSNNATTNTTTKTYPIPGTYTEWLVVGNTTCTDTIFFEVVVEPLITGGISMDSLEIDCFGAAVDLSVADPNPSYSYFWEVDGDTSTAENPSFFIDGNIIDTLVHINLTITNTCGTLMLQDTVLVPAIFNAGFGALQTDTVCHGELVTIANISTGFIDSFTIHYGNGIISTDTLLEQIYYNNDDTIICYQLMMVIYSDVCGTDTAYQNICVLPIQVTAGGWIDGFTGCEPLTRQFICYSTPGSVSTFYFGNGSSATGFSSGDTLNYTYQNAGIYYPYIIAVGCGIDTFSFDSVTVYELPDLGFAHQLEACADEAVTFTDTSTLVSNLKWYVNDSLVQSIDNLVYTFENSGTYTICMEGTGVLTQCVDTVCSQITILPKPIADFVASDTTGCEDLTVQFTDASIGNITGYYYEFGDGNTSALASSAHTYVDSGTYMVKYVVVDANTCISDTAFNDIVVYPIPTSDFTFTIMDSCTIPTDVQFTNLSEGAAGYEWTVDNSSNHLTMNNPTVNYTSADVYNINLTAISIYGCRDSSQQSFELFDPPIAAWTVEQQDPCQPSIVTFADSSTGNGIAHYYNFGDNNLSNQSSPVHTFSNAGTYTATYFVSDVAGCLSDTLTQNLEVPPNLTSDFSFTITDSCAMPVDVTFTNLSEGAANYLWRFGNSNSSDSINPVETYTVEGTYTVELVAENIFGCRDSIQQTFDLFAPPVAVWAVNQPSSCVSSEVTFINNTTGSGLNYFYDFGDNTTSNALSPTHTFNIIGTYQSTYFAIDTNGCVSDTLIEIIDVHPIPNGDFSLDVLNNCGNPVIVQSATDTIDVMNYSWFLNDSLSSINSQPSFSFNETQTAIVKLIKENIFGCLDTVVNSVKVDIAPYIELSNIINEGCIPFTPFYDLITASDSCFIDFGNGNISDNCNEIKPYDTPGEYELNISVFEGHCMADTSINIVVRPPLEIVALATPNPIELGDEVELSIEIIPDTVLIDSVAWEAQQVLNDVIDCDACPTTNLRPVITGEYTVFVRDDKECVDSSMVRVRVLPKAPFVPNVFTPNHDGNNDLFYLQVADGVIEIIEDVKIYDRWGNLVFHKTDIPPNNSDYGWDGTFKGEKMEIGVYVYTFNVLYVDGVKDVIYGNVTIIK